jgi:hypothetical protein
MRFVEKYIILSLLGLALMSGVSPVTAAATDDAAVKAAITVAATVPSRACPQFTIISTNVPEALADNSQKILVSVQLKDCEQALFPNSSVFLSTNRGAIDRADVVTASGSVVKQGYGTGVEGITGSDGKIYFNVYSDVPGEAILSLKADNTLLLGTKTVKFLALPFPKNISISISVPPIIGNIIPGYNKKESTLPLFVPQTQQYDTAKIVNLGVDLRLPFWLFILLALIILAIPTLSTSNILLLRRIRKEQKAVTTKIEEEVEEIQGEILAEQEEIHTELDRSKEEEKTPQN